MIRWLHQTLARAWALFRIRRLNLDQDLKEDLANHLDLLTQDYVRRGMSPSEARREASLSLGSVVNVVETHRDVRSLRWLEDIAQDVRYSLRVFVRYPGYSLAVMLGLTLGIGSTTTVFSIVDGILLKPLPFEDPEQLYRIDVSLPDEWTEVSVSEYEAWKSDNTTFTDIVTTSWGVLRRLGSPQARSFEGRAVPASLFRMLGADAVIGRTFLQEEDRPGGNPAVVLDYGTWQQDFGGDPSVIGQSLLLGDGYFPDRNYTILGVMPSAFAYPVTSAELWIPLGLERRLFSPLLSPLIRGLGPVTQKLPLSERSP